MTFGVDKNLSSPDIAKLLIKMLAPLTATYVKSPSVDQPLIVFNDPATSSPVLTIYRINKPPQQRWFHTAVPSQADVKSFIDRLQGRKGKENWKETFDIQVREVDEDGRVAGASKKRQRDGDDDNDNENKSYFDPSTLPLSSDTIRSSLTPYFHKSYPDQLILKGIDMKRRCVLKIQKEVRAAFEKKEREDRKSGNKNKNKKSNNNKPAWFVTSD